MVNLLKINIFVIFLNFTFNLLANDFYLAEGEFWATEDDSSKFIKEQLKTNALKNSLNKFFAQMELNSDVFWQLVDRKILTELEARKQSTDSKVETAREAGEFDKVIELESNWRRYRLNYITKFLESKRLYLSFSSSGITSSMVNPQLKMCKFKVTLNRNMVKRLYFEITKSDSNRKYQNLLISLKVEVSRDEENLPQELKESLSLIKAAVSQKWVSWLESEYKEIFNNFILTSEAQDRQLNRYIFSPPGSVNLVDMSMIEKVETTDLLVDGQTSESSDENKMKTTSIETGSENKSENEMNIFKDSQWLLVKIRLGDLEFDEDFKKLNIKISGGHLFFDLNSREIILSEDYLDDSRIYSTNDSKSFASAFGTTIFNLPLDGFREGKKVFTKAPQINNQAKITIKNLVKPEQIIKLSDFLNLGGDSVNLRVSSFDIVEEGAKITLNYFGEIDNLKKKFFEWENKKVIPQNRWHFYANEGELNAELLPEVSDSDQNSTKNKKLEEKM